METEEQSLEREQNERDVLEALGDYKCDAGMPVENMPAVVDIQTLKGRFYCTQVLYWVGGGDGEECGKEGECCWPVAVKYMSETHCWTQKLNKEDYGFAKCWVLLAVVKE